jgi:hypothetical protein
MNADTSSVPPTTNTSSFPRVPSLPTTSPGICSQEQHEPSTSKLRQCDGDRQENENTNTTHVVNRAKVV